LPIYVLGYGGKHGGVAGKGKLGAGPDVTNPCSTISGAGTSYDQNPAVQPPSAVSTVPFMKLDSSDPRNSAAAAISSDFPVLGMRACVRPARSMPNSLMSSMLELIFVSTAPGAMPLTRMPFLAYM